MTQPPEGALPSTDPLVLAILVQGGRWVAPFLDPETALGTVLLIRGLVWSSTHDQTHGVWRAEGTECTEVC